MDYCHQIKQPYKNFGMKMTRDNIQDGGLAEIYTL